MKGVDAPETLCETETSESPRMTFWQSALAGNSVISYGEQIVCIIMLSRRKPGANVKLCLSFDLL